MVGLSITAPTAVAVVAVVVAIGGVGMGLLVLTPMFGPSLGMAAVALEGKSKVQEGKVYYCPYLCSHSS